MKSHLRWVASAVLTCLACSVVSAQDIFAENLLEIRITFQEDNWRDILLNARHAGDNRRLNAVVKINNTSYENVQVRFKGNSSFHGAVKAGFKKIPLNLKAADDQPFAGGYETLKLANNYRDPSAVRELLAYRIAGTYVPVPGSVYAIVYVNDEYLGVYTATEGVSGTMTDRYFCGSKRGLVQCEPDFDRVTPQGCAKGSYSSLEYLGEDERCYQGLYEVKDSSEWRRIVRLSRVLRDSTGMVEEVLDVHLALWMHALNNVLVNLDSYLGYFCHNYYLYRDSLDIYHPLLWDLNLAFGGFHALKEGVDVDFATLSPIIHERYNLANRPLITKLLENRRYRRIYFSMMRTIVDEWFVSGRYLEIAKELQEQIRPHMDMEKGTFYKLSDFDNNLSVTVKTGARSIPGIQELMIARTDYLSQHPLLKPGAFSIESWQVESKEEESVVKVVITGDNPVSIRLWYQQLDCGSYSPIVMTRTSRMSEYACQIPVRPYSFYFEIEGEETANLWPLQAPGKSIRPEVENVR